MADHNAAAQCSWRPTEDAGSPRRPLIAWASWPWRAASRGHPGWQPPDGYVYLKQFSTAGAFISRVRIGIGLDGAELAGIPHTGSVLATLNQGANGPWPERDWVFEFNGTHLRPIAHYKAWDANQIDAVPW